MFSTFTLPKQTLAEPLISTFPFFYITLSVVWAFLLISSRGFVDDCTRLRHKKIKFIFLEVFPTGAPTGNLQKFAEHFQKKYFVTCGTIGEKCKYGYLRNYSLNRTEILGPAS